MARTILREALVICLETALILAFVAAWGIPRTERRPASAEAAVFSFEQSMAPRR